MFICEKCNKTTEPNESCHLVITEKREKVYHNKKKIEKPTGDSFKEWDTRGWEIVKTMKVCNKCM